MIDVGMQRPPIELPDETFTALKKHLSDPARYFLGEHYRAVVLPGPDGSSEYYGFPASKSYVFRSPPYFRYESRNGAPLVSFATGGLAEAWTGGCYAFDDAELSEFPFTYSDLKPHYDEIARRIGIAGEVDDLSYHFPHHEHLSQPLSLDENSARLYSRYKKNCHALVEKHKIKMGRSRNKNCHALVEKHKIKMGRSRNAVIAQGRDGRGGCRYCGRCLWGCPNGAFYTPSLTLNQCISHEKFSYHPGYFASHFHLARNFEIEHLTAYRLNGVHETFRADAFVLACGAISTSNLVLRSVYRSTGDIIRLSGLTNNRQVLAPFFNLSMLGRIYNPETYQYHQLAVGLETENPSEYIHGQITTLKTVTAHPIVQNLPLDLRSATNVFSNLRSSLGLLSLFFCDYRREESYVTLAPVANYGEEAAWPALLIHYVPSKVEEAPIRKVVTKFRHFFRTLGAPLIPGMTKIRSMGKVEHYSGTLPMSRTRKTWAVSDNCQSYDIPNMFVVDGSTFPFLPAKNLTFTLMANAARVAESL
jgi:choline dehydrogenase-like flavoprotein